MMMMMMMMMSVCMCVYGGNITAEKDHYCR